MNKKIITGGTIGLTFLLNANISLATDSCAVASNCEELGYTETSCTFGFSSIKCPFDSSKMHCDKIGTGISNGYCYENNELVGVQIADTNYCISLDEEDCRTPNSKWKNGETAIDEDIDESTAWNYSTTSSYADSYKACGYYSWGYLMGYNKNCYGETCGSVEQSGSFCKTVKGSNWRMFTCESHSKDSDCELYNLMSLNESSIDARLSAVGGTPVSNYYWSSTEYTSSYSWRVSSDGSFVEMTPKYHSTATSLRCIREF
ncbi:MAG: hypothetical protein R3Y43_05395 [Alphaproteobacteria bacterium]